MMMPSKIKKPSTPIVEPIIMFVSCDGGRVSTAIVVEVVVVKVEVVVSTLLVDGVPADGVMTAIGDVNGVFCRIVVGATKGGGTGVRTIGWIVVGATNGGGTGVRAIVVVGRV
jgi:hypothetical protein